MTLVRHAVPLGTSLLVIRVSAIIVDIPTLDVENFSVSDFNREFVQTLRPVILRLKSAKTWRAVTEWTLKYLLKACPDASISDFRYVGSSAWAGFENHGVTTLKKLVRSWQKADKTSSDPRSYGFDLDLKCSCPSIVEDFEVLKYFLNDYLFDNPYAFTSWPALIIGPRGTRSGIHIDNGRLPFWLTLATGKKHFRIVSEIDFPTDSKTKTALLNGADVFDDLYVNRELADVTVFEGMLFPGETIFIPSGAAHAARNLASSIAVTANYFDKHHLQQTCKGSFEQAEGISPHWFVCFQLLGTDEPLLSRKRVETPQADNVEHASMTPNSAKLMSEMSEGFCYRNALRCGVGLEHSDFVAERCYKQGLSVSDTALKLSQDPGLQQLLGASRVYADVTAKGGFVTYDRLHKELGRRDPSVARNAVNVSVENAHSSDPIYMSWLDPVAEMVGSQRELPLMVIAPRTRVSHQTFPEYELFFRTGPQSTSRLLQKYQVKRKSVQRIRLGQRKEL